MNWSSTILTSTTSDTEPTIVITFDSAKYIFNAGENTSRAFLQSLTNWKKSRALFLTAVGTKRAGGLAGLLMTFADSAISKLELIGPPGLLHFVAAMRFYTFRESISVKTTEATFNQSAETSPMYKDENVSVYAVPIIPEGAQIGSKRKRIGSPDIPSKRVNSDPAERPSEMPDGLPSSVLPATPLDAYGTSERAQGIRRQMLETMFPASGPSGSRSAILEFHDQLPNYVQHASVPSFSRPSDVTLAYALVGPRVRGKFDAQKAQVLEIPNGNIRSRLTKGETISFPIINGNGEQETRTVRPEDCLLESELPGVILVFDIPSVAHIPSLENAAKFSHISKYCTNSGLRKEFTVRAVYHLCGPGVLEHEDYKGFMNDFPPEVHHFVASKSHLPDPVSFTSSASNQLYFNKLDNEMFPIPKFDLEPARDILEVSGLPARTHLFRAGLRIDIRPLREPVLKVQDNFHSVVASPAVPLLSLATEVAFKKAAEHVADEVKAVGPVSPGDDVRVITLGTGSASPSKYRNVSGTLVQIPRWGNILLDAGEGTLGQIMRHFGEGAYDILRDLKLIFISHVHGDHQIGLAKLLAARNKLDPLTLTPLYLVATRNVHVYLREYSDLEDLGIDGLERNSVITVMADALHWKNRNSYQTQGVWAVRGTEPWLDLKRSQLLAEDICRTLGLTAIKTVDMRHRTRCYGLVMEHTDGWIISFSGDTMPCDAFAEAGRNSTLVIHEATMGDDEEVLAKLKGHSTFGQALAIGKKMNTNHLLLTHFSARYPKAPPPSSVMGNDETQGIALACAFDHSSMTIGSMWKMKYYLPAIQQFIKETEED